MNAASRDRPGNPLLFPETSRNPNQRQGVEGEDGAVGGEEGRRIMTRVITERVFMNL